MKKIFILILVSFCFTLAQAKVNKPIRSYNKNAKIIKPASKGKASNLPARLYSIDEVELIKSKLSSKLENNLSNYFGKIKFSVFLKLNTNTNINKGPQSTELVSLYMLENQTIKNEGAIKDTSIESAEVKVVVYELLKDSLNKDVMEIVKSTLEPVNTKVNISYLASTRPFYEKAETQTKEEPELFALFKSSLVKNFGEVIRLIGFVFLALAVIVGIMLFGKVIRSTMNSLTDSLKGFASKPTPPTKTNDDNKTNSKVVEQNENSEKFKDDLVVFKNILMEKPAAIAGLVLINDVNASGMRKILPYVFEKKYCDVIQEYFSEVHFSKMSQSQHAFASHTDFMQWFEGIIETVSLQVLNKRKNVLSGISDAQLDFIKTIPHQKFKTYLQESGSSIGYQIAMDLLPPLSKTEFLKNLDVAEWKVAFEVKNISELQINEEVENIIKYSSNSSDDKGSVSAANIHSSLIIPSLKAVIALKKIKEQDEFLSSLASISEESVRLIRQEFWTPKDVFNVPQTTLRESLRPYDVEIKSLIIFSMPEDVGAFLLETGIEGKAKEIVADRLKNSGNDFNQEQAEAAGISFINELYSNFKSGGFKLLQTNTERDLKLVQEHEADSSDENNKAA